MTDRRLALLIGLVLFLVAAWPLAFLHVPPYQDLPGHLAAVTILANPTLYPDFVQTGFLKPNSFFFLFTLGVGDKVGFLLAAKVFVAGVLAANAFVFPAFVLHFCDRRRMVLAAPFLLPMVHNWFVSMGMLNFAASVPAAFLLLIELDKNQVTPSLATTSRAAALALLAWYLHPLSIVVVGLLAMVASFGSRPRARALLPPLVPAATLAGVVLLRHAMAAAPRMESPVYSTPSWALYNLWSQWMYGFTELTAVSLVPAIVLAALAAIRWREGPALLGSGTTLALLLAYVFGPYVALDANYITPRLVPFFWAAALVRIPERLPRALHFVVLGSALVYAVGMPVDLLRLSRELDAFAAGTSAMPEGARLLPLNFNARPTSKNTFSLGTAWGLYVLERHTSAIDAWANVPSMPIMLKQPLPDELDPMRRLRFIKNAAHEGGFCAARRAGGFVETTDECHALWRSEWDRWWDRTAPGFDHILLWDPPGEVMATVPPAFAPSFERGKLHIFARMPARIED